MKGAGNKCALISEWLVKAIVKENDVRCRWNPKELVTFYENLPLKWPLWLMGAYMFKEQRAY